MRRAERGYVLGALAIVALVLGFIGYRQVSGPHYTISDATYWSILLFSGRLGEFSHVYETPLALNVARFLALAVTASVAIAAVMTLLRVRWDGWMVRSFASAHTIVAGGTGPAAAAATALLSAGARVVVVDTDPRGPTGISLRMAGARVIPGDATLAATCAAARVRQARRMLVLTGDDERNLEVLGAALEAVGPDRSGGPTFHVVIEDVSVWRALAITSLVAEGVSPLEFLNLADRAALSLADALALRGPYVPDNVLIDGTGAVAQRLVVHLVRRALLVSSPITIQLGPDSGALVDALRADEPWCLEAATIRARDADDVAAVAVVCRTGSTAEALARALTHAREGAAESVLVATWNRPPVAPLRAAGIASRKLVTIAIGAEALAGQLIDSSTLEILARAKHEDYQRLALERGETVDENPSLVPWDQLPGSLKESNRRFAEMVGAQVAQLGWELRPLSHAVATDEGAVPPEVLERLARTEHDRWMEALQRDGWQPTTGAKDPHRRLHPLLVPWEELPEEEREKDRDVIRGLPRMLALVGYELVVPDREPGSATSAAPALASRGPAEANAPGGAVSDSGLA